jgi:hypothetical protein
MLAWKSQGVKRGAGRLREPISCQLLMKNPNEQASIVLWEEACECWLVAYGYWPLLIVDGRELSGGSRGCGRRMRGMSRRIEDGDEGL